jgi:hypothetical protein
MAKVDAFVQDFTAFRVLVLERNKRASPTETKNLCAGQFKEQQMFKKLANKVGDKAIQVKQKLGKVEKTVDEDFETSRKRFAQHKAEVKSMLKILKSVQDALLNVHPNLTNLATSISNFESGNPDRYSKEFPSF